MNKSTAKKTKFWIKMTGLIMVCFSPLTFLRDQGGAHNNDSQVTSGHLQAQEAPSSSTSDSLAPPIAYPRTIKFALANLKPIIPLAPETIPARFENFYIKLLNNIDWLRISRDKTDTYTNGLVKIYNWYFTKTRTPSYSGNFPLAARFLFTNLEEKRARSNILGQFKVINGIPPDPESLHDARFKYIMPNVKNVLDERFGTKTPTVFPALNRFDYKMISIDTTLVPEAGTSYLEFEYTYNGAEKYRIFIRNKGGLLTKATATTKDLLANGNILVRRANKKYQPGDKPISLAKLNLAISKTGSKFNIYTSIKSKTDFSTLNVTTFSPAWKLATKVGLLESPLSPARIQSAIRAGRDYRLVPQLATTSFNGYSEKSDYDITSTRAASTIQTRRTFAIRFYMAQSEKIKIPIFYRNKAISGAALIALETNSAGQLKTTTPTLKIPNEDYESAVEPIKVRHRKAGGGLNVWTEVTIITGGNVIAGSKDFRSRSKKLIPGAFDLKLYDSANHRNIIFERPVVFTSPPAEITINYTKIFDSRNETAKLIGEAYYSAWGIYETPRFNVPGRPAGIAILNLAEPVFNGTSLSYKSYSQRTFTRSQTPRGARLVKNNFGKMIEDINDYSNLLGKIIKAISGANLHFGYESNYLKPSIKMQEQKFVSEVLMPKNEDQKVDRAFQELQFATEAFVNGQATLNDEKTRAERLPNIALPSGIENVKKADKKSWLDFALPRITMIVKSRYKTLLAEFERAVFDYKYNMITKLLEANAQNYKAGFLGINEGVTRTEIMQIGLKKQAMTVITNAKTRTTRFKSFQAKLETVLKKLAADPVVGKILPRRAAVRFSRQTQLLLADKKTRDKNQRLVYEAVKWVIKIIDFYAPQETSLLEILEINKFIKDDAQRLRTMIKTFAEAVRDIVRVRNINVLAYAIKASIEKQKINVAISNVRKVFDSFLAKKLSPRARAVVQKLKDYNYQSDPNKLAEIAVKIGDYNLEKFFDDITKNNIKVTSEKILELNPLLELPSKLPPQSRFVDIIKNASEKTNILFISIGMGTLLLGFLIGVIGYKNRKILNPTNKVLIVCSLVVLALVTIGIGVALPVAALPVMV